MSHFTNEIGEFPSPGKYGSQEFPVLTLRQLTENGNNAVRAAYFSMKMLREALEAIESGKKFVHPIFGEMEIDSLIATLLNPSIHELERSWIPVPDHKMGYTQRFIQEHLEKFGLIEKFSDFIQNQTVACNGGEIVYFTHDVLSFYESLQ